MHLLYDSRINRGLRSALRPVARFVPEGWQFPVTGMITVEVGEGKRIRLACNPTSYLAKVLFWQGVTGFEYNLVRIFRELVREARLFLDVGANIGYYSVLAAAFNPRIEIISFEPLPAAFVYLKRNLVLNGCNYATPLRVALSDTAGTARFFASKNPKFLDVPDHLTSTGALDEAQAARTAIVESFEVPTETLDHFMGTRGGAKVDLIKLDTEASEHLVLAGGRQVLSTHRPIILCEVLPGKIEEALDALFKQHEYRMYCAEPDGLVPVERLGHGHAAANDHVMVPADAVPLIERFERP